MVAEDCESTAYYRARYYNSFTGRFLSRDPEAGKPIDPKTLHKYLYAGGDPVNAMDPTGKDLVGDVLTRAWSATRTFFAATKIGASVVCYTYFIIDAANLAILMNNAGGSIGAGIAIAHDELTACLEIASLL